MTYDELGQNMAYMPPDVTVEHGLKQGMHDAIRDLIRLAFIGGTVIMLTALFFDREKVGKTLRRLT